MELSELPKDILSLLLAYLEQNDVISLACACPELRDLCMVRLYERIYLRRNPSLRSKAWFLDGFSTEVAGLRTLTKGEEQNDYMVYLKIRLLIENLPQYGHLVKEFTVFDGVFNDDSGTEHLNELVDAIEKYCVNLKRLEIHQHGVRLYNSPTMSSFVVDDMGKLDGVKFMEGLTLILHKNSDTLGLPSLDILSSLKTLVIEDEEQASLRLLKRLKEANIPPLKLKRFVFNHVHGNNNYNTVLRELTIEYIECINLSQIEELEMTIGCQEKGCSCLRNFLDDLAPKLTSVKKVALNEFTYQRDHYLTEEWDVAVGRFLINMPSKIKYLSVQHNPPLDGKLFNGLEGNYLRRKTIYENVMPKLVHLETFISSTFLQGCACYEVLPSDILWNGCECAFCARFLPLYDKYLMDHAYFDIEDTDFRDMISPRLFGLFGKELTKRLQYKNGLDALSIPPSDTHWDFHGYQYISCWSDVDGCDFGKLLFEPLVVCVSHFMLSSVKFLSHCLPQLKTVVLSGVYFTVDGGKVECVYDTEDLIEY